MRCKLHGTLDLTLVSAVPTALSRAPGTQWVFNKSVRRKGRETVKCVGIFGSPMTELFHAFILQLFIGCPLYATVLDDQCDIEQNRPCEATFSLGETDGNHIGK